MNTSDIHKPISNYPRTMVFLSKALLDLSLVILNKDMGQSLYRPFLRLLLHCFLLLLTSLLITVNTVQAKLKTGDILAVDAIGGTNSRGALFVVNPVNGKRKIISDFGNPDQGSLGNGDLAGVVLGAKGQIYVSSIFSGTPPFEGGSLFQIDPDSGFRTVISDFAQGDITGILYYGLGLDANKKVIANNYQSLVRVNPKTDERSFITDFLNQAQGTIDLDRFITDLAIERSGKIIIGTARGGGLPDSLIIRVDPLSGNRMVLSDFTNTSQGTDVVDLRFSTGLTVEASGKILVNSGGLEASRNLLLRIDPITGVRHVLSDFNNLTQGIEGSALWGLVLERTGNIIVGIGDAKIGALDATLLVRVSPNWEARFAE
jgi:hypothetical protein